MTVVPVVTVVIVVTAVTVVMVVTIVAIVTVVTEVTTKNLSQFFFNFFFTQLNSTMIKLKNTNCDKTQKLKL